MLKIYIQDHDEYGIIFVIAKSKAEARVLMRRADNYCVYTPVTEHEIEDGFMEYCLGEGWSCN